MTAVAGPNCTVQHFAVAGPNCTVQHFLLEPHLVQTCVWLGSSRPSKNNFRNKFNSFGYDTPDDIKKQKAKDKNKGKGKGVGKDKGQDKGKDKGKGEGKGKGVGKDKGKDKYEETASSSKRVRLVG